jgi:glutamine---fructose-6-phosphate transaminase (isomerizing)
MLQQKGTITSNEIAQQPDAWTDAIRVLNEKRQEIATWFRQEAFGQVIFMGCGSSYNAAIVSSRNFNSLTGVTTFAYPSAEMFATPKLPYDDRRKTLLIVFSRSGQSTETIWAVDRIRQLSKNTKILVFCPYRESELIGKADQSIILEKAKEEGVFATKSFTTFIFAVKLLTGILLQNMSLLQELTKVPTLVDIKQRQIEMQKIGSGKILHVICGGSGAMYGIAAEGALLIKKMCTIPAEAYNSLELRHGNAAAGNNLSFVIIFASDHLKKAEGVIVSELAALKSPRMVICEEADPKLSLCDFVINLKSGLSEYSRDMLMMPVVQLMAFYMCIARGYNPDRPKHVVPVVKYKDPLT